MLKIQKLCMLENLNIKIISLTVLNLKEFASSWTGKDHITRIIQSSGKGLTVLKTMASLKIPKHILLILYITFGTPLTGSVSNWVQPRIAHTIKRASKICDPQWEGVLIFCWTKDTLSEAMCQLLDYTHTCSRTPQTDTSQRLLKSSCKWPPAPC